MLQAMDGLKQRGHGITLASLNPLKHRQDPQALAHIGNVHALPVDTAPTALGALGAALFNTTPYPVLRYLHADFSVLLQRLVKAERFDVLQLETLFMLPYVDVLRRHSQAPIVLRVHNVEGEIWQRMAAFENHLGKKLYYRYLAKSVTRYEQTEAAHVDALLALSAADLSFFTRNGFRGIAAAVSPAVEVPSRDLQASTTHRHNFAYLGALNWPPNVQGLQWFVRQVMPLILVREAAAQFHIAGKDPLPQALALQSRSVTVHGPVPDAIAFLQQYDIVVVPVLSGSGVRLKMLEAMAQGKAIVTTTVGAQGLAVVHGRELLIADDPAQFATLVLQLLADPELAARLRQNAQAYVAQHHSMNSMLDSLERFYGTVIAKR
jgi:glycosyltransferase involved in cell wall biosynthesis